MPRYVRYQVTRRVVIEQPTYVVRKEPTFLERIVWPWFWGSLLVIGLAYLISSETLAVWSILSLLASLIVVFILDVIENGL